MPTEDPLSQRIHRLLAMADVQPDSSEALLVSGVVERLDRSLPVLNDEFSLLLEHISERRPNSLKFTSV